MTTAGCCHQRSNEEPPIRSTNRPGRLASTMTWLGPLATLTLTPKCPACLAAYLLLATGLGVSTAVATTIWWALILLSLGVLLIATIRIAKRPRSTR